MTKLKLLTFLCVCTLLYACNENGKKKFDSSPAIADRPLTEYVNPFIGTGGHGHTYPGATMPLG